MQTTQAAKETVAGGHPIPISYEEYLAWNTDGKIVEWVDGEAIIHMPPTDRHQLVVQFLERLLAMFVSLSELGMVRIAPFEVKLWPDGPSREPDIFFLMQENMERLSNERLSGPPDLVIEVISPGSVTLDRDDKFREYDVAGVREYWIIDSRPGRRRADFYWLDEDGRYMLFATEDEAVVNSRVLPNFWVRPEWLWQDALPDPLLTLAQIVGTESLIDHLRQVSEESDI